MSRISRRSETPVATQAALVRVTRGARTVREGPASGGVASAGASPFGEEEGSAVMLPTFLACEG